MDLSQFKKTFLDEASTLLVSLDNTLIELEKDPGNIQYINEAFRAMHTIKGAAGMYGFDQIVEITHEIESLFDVVRQNQGQVSQSLINLTFKSADHIRELLKDETFEKIENIQRHSEIKTIINNVRKQTGVVNKQPSEKEADKTKKEITNVCTWNILFYPNEEIIRRAINLVYTFHDLFQLGDYKISNSPYHKNKQQFWSIFLVTNQPYDEIEGTLLFVMDYCKITKIADYNIFDPVQIELHNKNYKQEEFSIINKPETDIKANIQAENPYQITINDESLTATNKRDNIVQTIEKHSNSRISVDASKLDQLMYLVSELVTTKSELILALERNSHSKALDTAEKIEKLSKLFSENALNIRLVSLHDLLSRFKRLIRDLSKQLNKSVDFIINGDDTELDKNIIDNIGEPLMHLIRNCIDHGIEIPQKRKEKGKPETGIVRFNAVKTGNNVYISISDDGNGIDLNNIYNKAVEKGFISPESVLSDKEIIDLIFLPGLSTAQSISDISGRGVGMDIVRKKIQDIRGDISITSENGIGTTFTLKLQQSVSIIETLLIEAEGLTYALPIEDIDACILEPGENFLNKNSHQMGYNGRLIPYICLREAFMHSTKAQSLTEKIIIINRVEKTYAIVADNIIGEFQAVVKPIGEAFSQLHFISGASLLGDGSIALLLDTDKLWYEISA